MNNRINYLDKQFTYKGGLSLKYRYECIGMLPEIYRLKVYEEKGFKSIFEYAAKKAGISKEQVRLTLQLDQKFEDKPTLHKALTKGEISLNKLARVRSVATKENEEFWAEKAKLLPQRALETLVRDERIATQVTAAATQESKNETRNGLFESKISDKNLHVQVLQLDMLQLDTDVEQELLELQNKGININQLLRGFLEKRKQELAQEKEELAAEIHAETRSTVSPEVAPHISTLVRGARAKSSAKLNGTISSKKPSHYIPAKIRKHLTKEYGTKCTIEHCNKPSTTIHHTQRHALSQNHDPRYLAPLCANHHTIAHSIDIKYHQKRLLVRSSLFS